MANGSNRNQGTQQQEQQKKKKKGRIHADIRVANYAAKIIFYMLDLSDLLHDIVM